MKKNITIIGALVLIIVIMFFAMKKPAGGVNDQPLTQSLIDSGVTIIDIRTEGEWRQTGIVSDSYPLTFFDEKGNYNAKAFLAELEKIVPDKNEKFGIICRSGNRTSKVLPLLKDSGYSNVFDILGGVQSAKRNGITLIPYK